MIALKKTTIERVFFFSLFCIWLSPVWFSSYFLTGDGPSHLYTSRIILDFLQHKHANMYGYFLTKNTNVDPNWLTNLIQVPLLYFFSGSMTERIFFTIYFSGFVLGIRFLIKQLNPSAIFLSSIAFLFVWNNLVFKGFLNNSLGFVVWFWIVGYWWKYRHQYSIKAFSIQILLGLLGYLSHPMCLIYSCLFISSLLVFVILKEYKERGIKTTLQLTGKQIFKLFIVFLPAILLTLHFVMRRKWSEESTSYDSYFIQNLIDAPCFIAFNFNELAWVKAISLLLITIFVFALIYKIIEKSFKETDGVFLFVLLTCLTVIYPPTGIMGGLDLQRRLVIMPFFSFLFCAAAIDWNKISITINRLVYACIAIFSIGLLTLRIPTHWQLAQFTNEVMTCNKYIAPQSIVMMLNYDLNPRSLTGVEMINREWINVHTDGYFGVEKPLIIADNYELNFDYFPFLGKGETNFYIHSSVDGLNFESQPPGLNMDAYFKKTGIQIDYVLLLGLKYKETFKDHPSTRNIMKQLDENFTKIYTSEHGVAVLYRNKSNFRNPWK